GETFEVNRLVANRVYAGDQVVNYTDTLENMGVDGQQGNDVVNVSPSLFTAFSANGNSPNWPGPFPLPGDTLHDATNAPCPNVCSGTIPSAARGPIYNPVAATSIEAVGLNAPEILPPLPTARSDMNAPGTATPPGYTPVLGSTESTPGLHYGWA